jgi:hypothetical protein
MSYTKVNEIDPDGKDQHEAGAKLDAGKPLAGLVLGDFANALSAVVKVGTFGAEKYSPSGWLYVEDAIQRYKDAHLRHWLKRNTREYLDPDSRLPHMYHEVWNALAVLELTMRSAHRQEDTTW